jgi:hypothetical protein
VLQTPPDGIHKEDAMRLTIHSGACAVVLACSVLSACSKTHEREVKSKTDEPTAAEQRRIDERRAEERRAEERRAEDRLATERKAERRAEDRRAEERRAEDRLAEQRRAEDRRDDRKPRLASDVEPKVRATPASALASLATERCDREARCKNIGDKEKYRTRAECMTEMQRDKRDDLNSDVCPGGIRQKELADCLQAIREENCNNPLDSLTRLNACRAGNLCAK